MNFFINLFQTFVFKNFVKDMLIGIFIGLERLYYLNLAMKKQIDNNNNKLYKAYIKLVID